MKRFSVILSLLALLTLAGCPSPESTPAGPTTVAVSSVTLDKASATVLASGTVTLTPTVLPANATTKTVTFTSNATGVATVNANTGVVTAVATGVATITATTTDGSKTAVAQISVPAATVSSTPNLTATATLTGFTDLGVITAAQAGNAWGAAVTDVQVASDGTNLYVAAIFNPQDGGNNIWVLVDDTTMSGGTTAFTNLIDYGNQSVTNVIGANFDFGVAGWRGSGSPTLTIEKFRSITGGVLSASNAAGVTCAQFSSGATNADVSTYKYTIPYAAIGTGAATGNPVHVYIIFGNGSIQSIYPAQSGFPGAGPISNLNMPDAGIILN